MAKIYFLTGTDTDIGKTHVMGVLLKQLQKHTNSVCGLKPIASGCEMIDGQLKNSDALLIEQSCDYPMNYQQLNPFAFEPAIAPHIAAEQVGKRLTVAGLTQAVEIPEVDVCLIEGAGGWLTPLNQTETYADWVEACQYEVILVIGMKLGCLNHAQLSIKDIQARGLKVAGWIANQCEPAMSNYEENLQWLQANLSVPFLGEVPFSPAGSPEKQAKLELTALL